MARKRRRAGGDAPGKPRKRARSNVIPPVLKDLKERAEEDDEAADITECPLFDDHEDWKFQQDGARCHTAN